MEKCCNNCWFYCHGNGKCYAAGLIKQVNDCFQEEEMAEEKDPMDFCSRWAFDGLEDWERSDQGSVAGGQIAVSGGQWSVVSECVE